jgi:FlaA1/EpsC-like NDP-sugar epimerase
MPNTLFKKLTPRWIIFCIEQLLICFSFLLSVFIIHHMELTVEKLFAFKGAFIINTTIALIFSIYYKTYCGIIRYSEIKDIQRVIYFSFCMTMAWFILDMIWGYTRFFKVISPGLLIINFCIISTFLIAFRLLVKEIYRRAQLPSNVNYRNILIYGAGALGITTKKAIELEKSDQMKVVGFIDKNFYLVDKTLDGLRIYDSHKGLEKLLREKKVNEIIIADRDLGPDEKIKFAEFCNSKNIKITVLPPEDLWKNGIFRVNQLRELTIESLLERDEIHFYNEQTKICFDKSVVLVSGGAGSIGSEICKQLIKYNIERLVLIDQSESGLHGLQLELASINDNVDVCLELASIRDKKRIEDIFTRYRPDYVFHAAAYKHVPIMEYFPTEAILTNVLGTRVLADISVKVKVRKFIFISTDKAVNPTNIMGVTKRIAEMYVQSLSEKQQNTQFITTRFGNVLGSIGSVVPIFRNQILKGGPITITHPDVTRFFMTIPEASRLVLEACVMGNGGEIFVFNMGKPIKIVDMAKKMVQLAGLTLDKEISIDYIGLRPGEKMFEELFKESETLIPTYHPKIMLAKRSDVDVAKFTGQLDNLIDLAYQHHYLQIRQLIRLIIPEYVEQGDNAGSHHLNQQKYFEVGNGIGSNHVNPQEYIEVGKSIISNHNNLQEFLKPGNNSLSNKAKPKDEPAVE